MLSEVSKEEWINITGRSKSYSIFTNPDFLEPLAKVFNYSLKYYLNFLNDKPAIGFACFIKGDKIKVPTHFIYSGIWWDINPDTIKFRNLLIESIEKLKSVYKSIELRLPPSVTDIRPYQWQGFNYKVNYTYIRDTLDLNFEYNVKSRVRKSEERGLVPAVSKSFENVWKHQNYDLKRFFFSDHLLSKLRIVFFEWFKNDFMFIYNTTMEGSLVGSSCVLYDKNQSKAYNLLISSANSNYHTGVHASLYNFIFKHLQSEGIREFDLYGADLRGVADFKSSFGAVLHAHYTVKYSKRAAVYSALKQRFRSKLVAIKSKLV